MTNDASATAQSFYEALYHAIAPTASGTTPPAQAPFTVMIWPALPIYGADYTNPRSLQNPGGLVSALQAFSMMVDVVPSLSPVFNPQGGSLSSCYQLALLASPLPSAQPASSPSRQPETAHPAVSASASATRLLRTSSGAPTPAYAAYLQAQQAHQAAVTTYDTARKQADLTSAAGQRAWMAQAPRLQLQVTQAATQLQSHSPATFQQAEMTAASSSAGVEQVLQLYQQRFLQAAESSLGPDGGQWWPAYAYPSNWMDDAAKGQFTHISVPVNPSPSAPHLTQIVARPSVFATMKHPLPRVLEFGKPDAAGRVQQALSSATNNLTLSLDFMSVTIQRPWFNEGLFGLHGIVVPGYAPGSFSTGTLDPVQNQPAFCPLIPMRLIVTRNVKIAAKWAPADVQQIKNGLAAKAAFRFGPFRTLTPAHNLPLPAPSFDNDTLSIPGLSLLAYVCNLVGFFPPAT